ncbi:2Fe-2S iron-sulfur cluster-binding protein [Aquariibacter albus]|uniref:2Fe-2S iron-sulfur cluster binding domain-containing protein n=1 Tax=Aquariibacter albus TaxID=2759899 RepID=A0A839HTU1_9BURK|nr:2Fe-2S iron-sulfur cluster-binding protein [Aquariibacter albus]MBB1163198.1 2Fe-2S iron-sulfur cluster binding domain-containing protein [Aquariibacter albus]
MSSGSEPRHAVRIVNTQEDYGCAASRTLLGGMEALGRRGIPAGCRGGGCGICKVRIETGTVRTDRMSRAHVSVDEEARGYVLACRAYPTSDVVLHAVDKLARCIERRPAEPAAPSPFLAAALQRVPPTP